MEIWPWLKWRIRNHDEQSLLISRLWSSSKTDWTEEPQFRERLIEESQDFAWQDLKLRAGEARPQNEFHFTKKAWKYPSSEPQDSSLDIEALHSLSRFFWLFDAELEKETQGPIHHILKWIRNPLSLSNLQLEAYNISERLANWGLWLGSHADQISRADQHEIQVSVKSQCQILLGRLEKKGLVGNHLFNNFRGLCWGAYLLRDSKLLELLVPPTLAALQRILDNDGSLREDSTHYHRLTAKNFAEVLHLQQSLNPKFKFESQQQWRLILELMLSAAKSMGSWTHLIGDVSPDAPPEDLLDFLDSAWVSYFPKEFLSQLKIRNDLTLNRFRKIENENWELVTHINPHFCPELPGHGHLDTFSFSLRHANEDFVVDPGRSSYEESHWCEAALHSGLMIDDVSDFYRKSYMGQRYLSDQGHTTFKDTQKNEICIERELKAGFKMQRFFVFRNGDLVVKDSVDCSSERSYALKKNFILSPSQVDNVRWPAHLGKPQVTNIFGSRRYGHTHPLCCVSFTQNLTGSHQDEITFSAPDKKASHASAN